MKQITQAIALIIITTLFYSCDKIDHPLQEGNIIVDDGDSTTVKRRILIEEFTGHFCSNCPEGAAEVQRLVGVYGDQIIPVSLHAGNITFNAPHTGAGSYETDFRTPDGDAYATTFLPFGLPSGMISRLSGATALPFAQWETEILSIKDIAPLAEVTIETSYNTTTRVVTMDIETEWLLDGSNDNYKLQVYIIEDHITDWQLDGSTDVPDYDHRHVLRGAVNTTWGETITSSSQGVKDNKSYTYTLAGNWDEDHCEIVAFVYKEGPDYEVIQANIHHVK